MATDDLDTPLGQNIPRKRKRGLPPAVPYVVAGLLGLFLLAFATWSLVVDDPLGGEPMAVTDLAQPPPPQKPDAAKPDPPATSAAAAAGPDPAQATPTGPAAPAGPAKPAAGSRTVTIIDGSSGRREDVTVAAPRSAAPPLDARLIESSRHGGIPRIGQDGARPSDVYARRGNGAAVKSDGPKIAIVIGGLGVGAIRTGEGLRKLPASVTLAFSPYAKNLDEWVSRARSNGHELMLQVSMEPFDFPDNDPGPQTLLTSLGADQNIDRLHWFLSRFQGYVGIVNFMGARFTAMEQALAPILRETAKRGLIYLDDASSPRSLASQIAGANNAAFAKANVLIDAAPTVNDIDAALARLEQTARDRGQAIGMATALPVSIERIAKWAQQAEKRGIALVPLSAIANRPKSSS